MTTQHSRTPPLSDIRAAALGRWPQIHTALGIPPEYLNPRKHCPCPYCGGRDRYRYTDHQGSGGFICNQCTPEGGSGFDLLMLVFGYDFATAARNVAAAVGLSGSPAGQHRPRPAAPAMPPPPPVDKQAALAALMQAAHPLASGDPVSAYLQGRGIPADIVASAANIRHHPTLPMWAEVNGHWQTIGHHPAMLAAITDTGGHLQGLHQTFLQPKPHGHGWQKLAAAHPETGEPLPTKKMQSRHTGSLKGAGVWLTPHQSPKRLLVAEGIETTLAARALFPWPDLSAVATLSTWGMAFLQWPPGCETLFIVADHDPHGAGYRAAHDLAVRAIKSGLAAHIWQPDMPGMDALDELNHRQQRGKA